MSCYNNLFTDYFEHFSLFASNGSPSKYFVRNSGKCLSWVYPWEWPTDFCSCSSPLRKFKSRALQGIHAACTMAQPRRVGTILAQPSGLWYVGHVREVRTPLGDFDEEAMPRLWLACLFGSLWGMYSAAFRTFLLFFFEVQCSLNPLAFMQLFFISLNYSGPHYNSLQWQLVFRVSQHL